MNSKQQKAKLYRIIVDILTVSPEYRASLVDSALERCNLPKECLSDQSADSEKNKLRGEIGALINEMHAAALIGIDKNGAYYLVSTKPIAIRIERCQKELIKALAQGPMTKSEINLRLRSAIGTDKTTTLKDDEMLSTYIGKLLKKMLAQNIIELNHGVYTLTPQVSAKSNDVNQMLSLKSEFISRLHTKGGEFFENFFMTLLKKYSEKNGKKVLECYVKGGSADGGIDGIMKTEDHLGFREIIMVQTKNRIELTSETDVRGFYGAVCANKGTRGIFAVTSDFHSSAEQFLNSLDDCVGINGDTLFSMAISCNYGIKRTGKTLTVDSKII